MKKIKSVKMEINCEKSDEESIELEVRDRKTGEKKIYQFETLEHLENFIREIKNQSL